MQLPLHSPICVLCKQEASSCSCTVPPGKELATLLLDSRETTTLDDGIELWARHLELHPFAWAFNVRPFLKQLIDGGSFHKGLEKVGSRLC